MRQVIMGIRVEIINKRDNSIMIEWAAWKLKD